MGIWRPDAAAVEVLPMPQFEHQQLPQSKRVIARAGQMFANQPSNERRFEVPTLLGSRGMQDVGKQICQSSSEPHAERHAKTLLTSLEDACRKHRPERLLQDVLPASIFNLE